MIGLKFNTSLNHVFHFCSASDKENHTSGQPNVGHRCEVRPQAHGTDVDHLLGRWSGADLRGSGCDEPESVVAAARDLLQAQLQLHLLEPLKVRLQAHF